MWFSFYTLTVSSRSGSCPHSNAFIDSCPTEAHAWRIAEPLNRDMTAAAVSDIS